MIKLSDSIATRAVTAITTVAVAVTLGACGGGQAPAQDSTEGTTPMEEQAPVELTAGEALDQLRNLNQNVTDVLVWDESTDSNGLLGRPGEYVSKADFSDGRVKELWETEEERMESGLAGGTLETFSSESDCTKRLDHLKKFMGADMGVFGLNQYVYKYPKAIFRVSFDVVPSEAEIYKGQMDEILGTVSEQVVAE